MKIKILFAASMFAIITAIQAWAQVPPLINYQGKLTDSNGIPLSAQVEITFSLYDASSGGTSLWTETHADVSVNNGLFSVLLGSVDSLESSYFPTNSGITRWLEVEVNGETLVPRKEMVSVAYAIKAGDADTLDGKDSTELGIISTAQDPLIISNGTIFLHYDTNDFELKGQIGLIDRFVDAAGDTMTGDLIMSGTAVIQGTDIIDSQAIKEGTIVNTDIAANAQISASKIIEEDPIFTSYPAYGITAQNILDWATAFGWGDHSAAGYLLAETDPQVGTNEDNYVPRWDADALNEGVTGALVKGAIYDPGNGRIGLGTNDPQQTIHIATGGVMFADGSVQTSAARTYTNSGPILITNSTVFLNYSTNDFDLTNDTMLVVKDKWVDEDGDEMTGDLLMIGAAKIQGTNIIDSWAITDYTIIDGDISPTAAIARTKIANTALVENTSFGGMVYGLWNNLKITTNVVTGDMIKDKTIMNDDIATNANISASKINEVDPTVTNWVKNGVTWAEVRDLGGDIPDDFSDGYISWLEVSNRPTFLTLEADPQVGTNQDNYVPRWDANVLNEGVTGALVKGTIYDPGTGNIGIGTTSPGNYKLNIRGDATTAGLRVRSSVSPERTMLVEDNAGATLFEIYSDKASFPNGNVGIGTTSPGANLHVVGSTRTDRMTLGSVGTAGVGGDYYSIYHETGDWISPYPDLVIQYHTGIKYDAYGAYGGHRFYTGYDGSGNPAGLKLSIDDNVIVHSGNVGIGTTTPQRKLHVNGVIRVSSGDYRIESDPGENNPYAPYYSFLALRADDYSTALVPGPYGFRVTNYQNQPLNNLVLRNDGNLWIKGYLTQGSDSRGKLNQEELDYGLAQVMELQPKRYLRAEWAIDEETGEIEVQEENATNDIGLVAQEVYEVIPEAVTVPEDETKETWGIKYAGIVAVLVKAMQEQQQAIEQQQAEIEALKKDVAALKGQ